MFKISNHDIEKLFDNEDCHRIFDNISNKFLRKKSDLSKIDFDNCLIQYNLHDKRLIILPDNLPQISIEDKLKYSLPDDIIIVDKLDNAFSIKGLYYDNIQNLDIDLQLVIIKTSIDDLYMKTQFKEIKLKYR